jgi:hypothetical protein
MRQPLGQSARSHRLAAGQKGLHQMAKNLARALGKALRHNKGGTRIEGQDIENPNFSALRLRAGRDRL